MKNEGKIQVVCEALDKFDGDRLDQLPNFTTFRLELEHHKGISHGELLEILEDLHSSGYYVEVIEKLGVHIK